MRPMKWYCAALLTGVLAVAGCGAQVDKAEQQHDQRAGNPAVVDKVPAALRDKGTLTVMTNPTYPPLESIDASGKMVGSDIDLMNAIAGQMGLKVDWQQGSFDGIIPGLAAKRFDAAIAGMYITPDKYDSVTMIQYEVNFDDILVRGDSTGPTNLNDYPALCGMSIAIQTGSTLTDAFNSASAQCVKNGEGAIKLLPFQSNNDALLAVTSGRADAATTGNVNTEYQIKEAEADLKVAGSLPQKNYAGITVQRDATQLADAISTALTELKKDGTYDKILAEWKMPSAAVDAFPVNPNLQ